MLPSSRIVLPVIVAPSIHSNRKIDGTGPVSNVQPTTRTSALPTAPSPWTQTADWSVWPLSQATNRQPRMTVWRT